MKEILNQKLANLPKTPYSKGGDIFMEGKSDMPSQEPKPTDPKINGSENAKKAPQAPKLEVKKPVSEERQATAKKAWEELNRWEKLNSGRDVSVDEARVQQMMIEGGISPVAGGAPEPGEPGEPQQPPTPEPSGAGQDGESPPTPPAEATAPSAEEPESESQRDAIKRLIEKHARGTPERREEIVQLLKQFSPLGTYVPEMLVDYSLEYDDVFESLVNRIVSLPLDKETSDYSLGLYAGSNLEVMSDRVTQAIDRTGHVPERNRLMKLKERLTLAQESSALIHNMNKLVITGEMEGFIRISEGITPDHLNYLQKLDGVGVTMQVYDEIYQKYLAKYGWIYPFVAKQIHQEVFERLGEYNQQKVFGERQLEEWELRRAYNVGRKFFNTSFRSAELVATGTVPVDLVAKAKAAMVKAIGEAISRGDNATEKELRDELAELEKKGKQRYSSFPLETAARIMNPVQLTIYRFFMAESAGAQIFLEKAKKHYQEFLKRNGDKRGANAITTLGGISVEQMEYGGVFGVSGIYSSWRNENFFFPQMKIVINGEETSVRDWLANHSYEIESAKNAKDEKALARALEPLMDNMGVGLGILLKQSVFSGELAYNARRQLWGKILLGKRYEGVDVDPKAEENPELGNLPLLINYLTEIQSKGGLIRSVDRIKAENNPSYWTEVPGEGKFSRWELLLKKINIQHNINIKRSVGQASGAQPPEFTNEERTLIKTIKLEGKKLPEHLADIAFPYVPFMNDAPFEIFNYEIAGAEFYRRRAAGDIPSYFNAAKAFMAILDNPGGMGIEEALKQFRELERGIESPNGSEDAQKRTFPLFETWIDWVMTRPGERQVILKSIKQSMQKHTSDAQEWSGMSAPTLSEQQVRDLIEQAVAARILDAKLGEELKKKKNVKFLGIFWMFLRDVFSTVIPGIAVYSFGKEVVNTKR